MSGPQHSPKASPSFTFVPMVSLICLTLTGEEAGGTPDSSLCPLVQVIYAPRPNGKPLAAPSLEEVGKDCELLP